MKSNSASLIICAVLYSLGVTTAGFAATTARANPNAGAGSVIVRGQFGGDIFGFDVDPASNEGLLCEAASNRDGTIHAAIETFDQATGQIIAVVQETETQDDFVAFGVFGHSAGLAEHEEVGGIFNVRRTFATLIPLANNRITGSWTPPLDSNHIVNQVKSSSADSSDVAVYALDVSVANLPIVFTSNLEANTFSTPIAITDPIFTSEAPPLIVYDNVRNQIILGHDFPSAFTLPPKIGFVNLKTGRLTKQKGAGLGVIDGLALDAADGIFCTDTSGDQSVQFYDMINRTAESEQLPGAQKGTNIANGSDIEFDPLNKLFLVAQEFSGTAASGSSIQVYDILGNFVESVDGLNFQGGFDVFPIHLSLNPNTRTGFVQGPDLTTSLQSFTY